MSKHTKGPWIMDRSATVFTVSGPNGDEIVMRQRSGMLPTITDARLIASAPELLAALTDLLAWVDEDLIHEPGALRDRVNARAVIRKATGQE